MAVIAMLMLASGSASRTLLQGAQDRGPAQEQQQQQHTDPFAPLTSLFEKGIQAIGSLIKNETSPQGPTRPVGDARTGGSPTAEGTPTPVSEGINSTLAGLGQAVGSALASIFHPGGHANRNGTVSHTTVGSGGNSNTGGPTFVYPAGSRFEMGSPNGAAGAGAAQLVLSSVSAAAVLLLLA